ncbi:putative pectinesterase 10, partial [Mucuna pruriens]
QQRNSSNETTGFVFKNCNFTGTGGKAILGRSLRDYSRVIVANSFLSDVVRPEGWNALYPNQEATVTYVEEGNTGPGANQSQRVKYVKHLSGFALDQFLNISFIDTEGWIGQLPTKIFV